MMVGLQIFFGICFTAFTCCVIKALQSGHTELHALVGKDLDESLATVAKWKTQTVVVLQ